MTLVYYLLNTYIRVAELESACPLCIRSRRNEYRFRGAIGAGHRGEADLQGEEAAAAPPGCGGPQSGFATF